MDKLHYRHMAETNCCGLLMLVTKPANTKKPVLGDHINAAGILERIN